MLGLSDEGDAGGEDGGDDEEKEDAFAAELGHAEVDNDKMSFNSEDPDAIMKHAEMTLNSSPTKKNRVGAADAIYDL